MFHSLCCQCRCAPFLLFSLSPLSVCVVVVCLFYFYSICFFDAIFLSPSTSPGFMRLEPSSLNLQSCSSSNSTSPLNGEFERRSNSTISSGINSEGVFVLLGGKGGSSDLNKGIEGAGEAPRELMKLSKLKRGGEEEDS